MLNRILNAEEVKNLINSINDIIIIDNCGCHGMNHALRVMKYVEIILEGIGLAEHDIELGMIAAYLHDTGAIEGKDGHAKRSAEFAQKYLKSLNMDENDINVIVHAIADHSSGKEITSPIGAALTFADKIDMFKDRMLRFKEGNYFHDNVKHMLNIEVSVDSDSISVNIVTDGKFDYNSLKDYSKMITKPLEMSKYLNRECTFTVDKKLVDLISIVNNKEKTK